MAEENKYDHDSVQELLAWAKEALSNKSYPDGKFQINKATTVLDCASFLSSMIQMISRNWENPTFYPTIDQLREFRKKIESKKE
jgi:hypothetical protein